MTQHSSSVLDDNASSLVKGRVVVVCGMVWDWTGGDVLQTGGKSDDVGLQRPVTTGATI